MYFKVYAIIDANIDCDFVSGTNAFYITFQMELKTLFLVLVISCTANCMEDNGAKEKGNVSHSLKNSATNSVTFRV